jgi:hypothetical protein
MLRTSVCALGGLLFVACGLLVGGDEEKDKKGKGKEVEGKIKSVEIEKRIILVTLKDGKDKKYTIDKDAKILFGAKGDRKVKLEDLKKGMTVTLRIDPKKGNGEGLVTQIRVKRAGKKKGNGEGK